MCNLSKYCSNSLFGLLSKNTPNYNSKHTNLTHTIRSPKIPQIISGNFFSHAMGHRTEQVPQREVLIKTPPKGAGFQLAPAVCSLVDVMKRVNYLEPEKPLATKGQAQKR
ncbi:hypothetical protein AVEN_241733-1 [Araneus ventricosus]|uniref:Uncharacterized protein n=1 Tax=Araneus ventricosus TaxID=182803 RepID=A0A4Y2TFW3_ARAVE|nr:hypothetical protein AVEN_241733-1 [Araneus ventricosus]